MIALLFGLLAVSAATDFHTWKRAHNKVYAPLEEFKRTLIYASNKAFIEEYNNRADTMMTLGLNQFADLTHDEFKAKYLTPTNMLNETYMRMTEEASTFIPLDADVAVNVPDEMDWRKHGAVTPVKNQGQCGSCYSFSTTGSLEGMWFRKTGKLISLSEQQIVDCSGAYGNNGCNGGMMISGFKYIRDIGGLDTEESYGYEESVGKCRFNAANVAAKVTGFISFPFGGEEMMKQAVGTLSPISVAIDAGHRSLQFYTGGIYYEPECNAMGINHAVLAVGYGTTFNNIDYWIVKNSWGTGWGDHGYIKMVRNFYNHCGIATMSSMPMV